MPRNSVVAFGELPLRLDSPTGVRLGGAKQYAAIYGGTESNVLVALSSWGEKTSLISALPDNSLGQGGINHLRQYGVDVSFVKRSGDKMGIYFTQNGYGEDRGELLYDRKGSAFALEDFGSDGFSDALADAKWLHISGITLAVSEKARVYAMTLLLAAKAKGIPTSFDFNYRCKLWTKEEARVAFLKVLPFVDYVFGSPLDLRTFLGYEGTDEEVEKAFFADYEVKGLFHTNREILDSTRNSLGATGYLRGPKGILREEVAPFMFEALDRIGAGDAFDAGVIYGLLHEEDLKSILALGWSAAILKHEFKGDVLSIPLADVLDYLHNHKKGLVR